MPSKRWYSCVKDLTTNEIAIDRELTVEQKLIASPEFKELASDYSLIRERVIEEYNKYATQRQAAAKKSKAEEQIFIKDYRLDETFKQELSEKMLKVSAGIEKQLESLDGMTREKLFEIIDNINVQSRTASCLGDFSCIVTICTDPLNGKPIDPCSTVDRGPACAASCCSQLFDPIFIPQLNICLSLPYPQVAPCLNALNDLVINVLLPQSYDCACFCAGGGCCTI
jgi:hypothetical protein